jgi:hypothetical protein
MKLDKSDAFLVYSVLFAYSNSDVTFSEEDAEHLEVLQTRLREYVLGREESDEHEECAECTHDEDEEDFDDEEEEEEEEEEDDDQNEPVELYISPSAASNLSPAKVVAPDGSTVSLEFEDVGEESTVDILVDDGAVILDGISKIMLKKEWVSVYDGEQWHPFKVVKLPKMWKKTFPSDMVVGFHGEDEE